MYDLVGVDGNAFSIMGYVARAMKRCGKTPTEVTQYRNEAMKGDYNHLLAVSLDMIDALNAEAV